MSANTIYASLHTVGKSGGVHIVRLVARELDDGDFVDFELADVPANLVVTGVAGGENFGLQIEPYPGQAYVYHLQDGNSIEFSGDTTSAHIKYPGRYRLLMDLGEEEE